MKARSVVVYTVLRLLAFLVPFGILMLFPVFHPLPWLAAVFAALIGLSLSLLFLRRPLDDVTSGLAARRATADADGSGPTHAASPAASSGDSSRPGRIRRSVAAEDAAAEDRD